MYSLCHPATLVAPVVPHRAMETCRLILGDQSRNLLPQNIENLQVRRRANHKPVGYLRRGIKKIGKVELQYKRGGSPSRHKLNEMW